VAAAAWPFLCLDAAINGARAKFVRADLAALPAMLDRIDAWIATGALGLDRPTAADYQVAGSLRMLLNVEDLAPVFSERPAAAVARRLIPDFPGRIPSGVLPAAWVAG
jgi:glutathione S-transferase